MVNEFLTGLGVDAGIAALIAEGNASPEVVNGALRSVKEKIAEEVVKDPKIAKGMSATIRETERGIILGETKSTLSKIFGISLDTGEHIESVLQKIDGQSKDKFKTTDERIKILEEEKRKYADELNHLKEKEIPGLKNSYEEKFHKERVRNAINREIIELMPTGLVPEAYKNAYRLFHSIANDEGYSFAFGGDDGNNLEIKDRNGVNIKNNKDDAALSTKEIIAAKISVTIPLNTNKQQQLPPKNNNLRTDPQPEPPGKNGRQLSSAQQKAIDHQKKLEAAQPKKK